MKFSDKYIQSLRPTEKRRYIREQHGFAIRVQPSGLRTFFYIFELAGKRQHINLGDYPDVTLAEARLKFQEVYSQVAKGTPPEPKEAPMHFKDFANKYLLWSEQNHSPAWHKTIKLSLVNDVLPVLGNKTLLSIRRRDAIDLLEQVAHRAPGQSANVQKAARGVFEYALQREYCEHNPFTKLSKVVPDLVPTKRDRVLTESEIRTLWWTLDDSACSNALRLILLTAQRPGEVAGMRRNEIEGCVWVIPKERAEKGQGAHSVPLLQYAARIIQDQPGDIFEVKRNSLSQVLSRAKYHGLKRFTPHDLRRTARTLMAKLGIPEEHAEAVLNHTKRGMVRVYNQYQYLEEKRAALFQLQQEVIRLVNRID